MANFSRLDPNLDKLGLSGPSSTHIGCINNADPDSFLKPRRIRIWFWVQPNPDFRNPDPDYGVL